MKNGTLTLFAAVAILAAVKASMCLASIDKDPVRVTYKNSGPKYEFDNVERQPISDSDSPANNEVPPYSKPSRNEPEEQATNSEDNSNSNSNKDANLAFPFGHLSIRRLILVPVSSSPSNDDDDDDKQQQPAPVDPFRFAMHRHLFGSDMPSRSPFGMAGSDMSPDASEQSSDSKETRIPPQADSAVQPQQPMIDPYQFMMDLLHHALASRVPGPSFFGQPPASDLSKDESAIANSEANADGQKTDQKPVSTNETKSEVVEIDGQKFIRKTVIQKHVAPGVVFITKKLIFSPANETDSSSSTTATTPVLATNINKNDASPSETTSEQVTTATGAPKPNSTSLEKEGDASPQASNAPAEQPKAGDKLVSISGAPQQQLASSTTTTQASVVADEIKPID